MLEYKSWRNNKIERGKNGDSSDFKCIENIILVKLKLKMPETLFNLLYL